jgi:hypothetical protein
MPGAELVRALEDAEALLVYAAEAGKEIGPPIIGPIVMARSALIHGTWNDETSIALLAALGALSALIGRVTAETLRASSGDTRKVLRVYYRFGIGLALVILIVSFMVSMTNTLSDDISRGVESADALAVKLRAQLEAPPGPLADDERCVSVDQGAAAPLAVATSPAMNVGPPAGTPTLDAGLAAARAKGLSEAELIEELQSFAAGIRLLNSRASRLNAMVFQLESSPFQRGDKEEEAHFQLRIRQYLQLQPELIDFQRQAFCKIYVFEDVRNFAQNVQADRTAWFGAISSYLLPVLYALAGAFAYRLREVQMQLRERTYHPTYADWARIVTAIIAGVIVSLFNDFAKGTSLSPLAVAFLVGFGVEIFFAFLDRLLISFGQQASTTGPTR